MSEETKEQIVEDLISKISKEIRSAHESRYDSEKAELSAALALDAQFELTEFLADAELLAKECKAEVERIEGEQYFDHKTNAPGKTTDAGLKHMVSKDDKVMAAKKAQFKAEADYNKWKNFFAVLKDAHIYFRSLAKGKSEF